MLLFHHFGNCGYKVPASILAFLSIPTWKRFFIAVQNLLGLNVRSNHHTHHTHFHSLPYYNEALKPHANPRRVGAKEFHPWELLKLQSAIQMLILASSRMRQTNWCVITDTSFVFPQLIYPTILIFDESDQAIVFY